MVALYTRARTATARPMSKNKNIKNTKNIKNIKNNNKRPISKSLILASQDLQNLNPKVSVKRDQRDLIYREKRPNIQAKENQQDIQNLKPPGIPCNEIWC